MSLSVKQEIFNKVKAQIATIPEIASFDLQKGQLYNAEEGILTKVTPVCLMEFKSIRYAYTTERVRGGRAVISLYLYTKPYDIQNPEPERASEELKLIDEVVEKIQGVEGTHFSALSQILEESVVRSFRISPNYRLDFEAGIYKQIKPRYPLREKLSEDSALITAELKDKTY